MRVSYRGGRVFNFNAMIRGAGRKCKNFEQLWHSVVIAQFIWQAKIVF